MHNSEHRRVRIGFDARWYNDSGVGTYVMELLRAIAAAPREFDLVVYEDLKNPVSELDSSRIFRIPLKSRRYSLLQHWELRRRVREDAIDLFHAPFYAAPLTLGCPMVITIHDLIPFLFRISGWPKQTTIRAGYRLAARRAVHLIADSENTARDLRSLLRVPAARITTVPLAARECFQPVGPESELDRLRKQHGVESPYVMISSAHNWRTKNLEGAFAALEIAREQAGRDFQTVVCGPPEGINSVTSQALQGVNLRVLGYVESAELAALLRNAHAFLTASLYEGFGLPIVEAMACGCPVVSSDGGSLAEVAGPGAQLFSPLDVTGLGSALARLLRHPEARRRWKSAALQRAVEFSWAKTAAKTMSVYHQVLKERALPVESIARVAPVA